MTPQQPPTDALRAAVTLLRLRVALLHLSVAVQAAQARRATQTRMLAEMMSRHDRLDA